MCTPQLPRVSRLAFAPEARLRESWLGRTQHRKRRGASEYDATSCPGGRTMRRDRRHAVGLRFPH